MTNRENIRDLPDRMLSPREVSAMTKTDLKIVYRDIREGRLAAKRFGARAIRIWLSDVLAYVDAMPDVVNQSRRGASADGSR